jgi:hypothetical protein
MAEIDKVILCDNKTKNAGIAIVTARPFDEVNVQMNESKRLGYFFIIPKQQKDGQLVTNYTAIYYF